MSIRQKMRYSGFLWHEKETRRAEKLKKEEFITNKLHSVFRDILGKPLTSKTTENEDIISISPKIQEKGKFPLRFDLYTEVK